ncbi:hypothetical protein [Streptomyces sp. Z26]|uniref:hypothetical protein n=1 Tax=Streptomyces sp. Z26 TaxID=2500177 RepID=UPI000EF1406C|nr:hypothetical protein [Streptomyces sp. Z26]RLL69519.1 hypothetical protein D7M15_24855 [Streptomyces sp. Z26]
MNAAPGTRTGPAEPGDDPVAEHAGERTGAPAGQEPPGDGPAAGGPPAGGPAQPYASGPPPERGSPQWLRRRLVTLAVVFLLIAIPAGYLVMSAFVSRDTGRSKAREVTLTSLYWHWPSRVQQRIYDVDVPDHARNVAYYEQNSWKVSSLHTQFRVQHRKLDAFLTSVGSSRSALKEGWRNGVTKEHGDEVGWDFEAGEHRYWGMVHQRSKGTPELEITVDTSTPKATVYVVSTVRFRGP